MRCHKCVSSTTLGIGETLLNAPSAMLHHWNILQTHDGDWEVPSTSLPLLFTSTESYEASTHLSKILKTGRMMFFPIHIFAATSGLVNTIFVKW
jgi:hypothetical protein